MKKLWQIIAYKWRYRKTWGTTVGQDCISLDTSLCNWLGHRLVFLSEHTHSAPFDYAGFDNFDVVYDLWRDDLLGHGLSLLRWTERYDHDWDEAEEHTNYVDAQVALRWVADNLSNLWD